MRNYAAYLRIGAHQFYIDQDNNDLYTYRGVVWAKLPFQACGDRDKDREACEQWLHEEGL